MCTDLRALGNGGRAGGGTTAEKTSPALVQPALGRVQSSFDLEITAHWFLLLRVLRHVEIFSDTQL